MTRADEQHFSADIDFVNGRKWTRKDGVWSSPGCLDFKEDGKGAYIVKGYPGEEDLRTYSFAFAARAAEVRKMR